MTYVCMQPKAKCNDGVQRKTNADTDLPVYVVQSTAIDTSSMSR